MSQGQEPNGNNQQRPRVPWVPTPADNPEERFRNKLGLLLSALPEIPKKEALEQMRDLIDFVDGMLAEGPSDPARTHMIVGLMEFWLKTIHDQLDRAGTQMPLGKQMEIAKRRLDSFGYVLDSMSVEWR